MCVYVLILNIIFQNNIFIPFTVGSSLKASSPTSALDSASLIFWVGFVKVSLRRSTTITWKRFDYYILSNRKLKES